MKNKQCEFKYYPRINEKILSINDFFDFLKNKYQYTTYSISKVRSYYKKEEFVDTYYYNININTIYKCKIKAYSNNDDIPFILKIKFKFDDEHLLKSDELISEFEYFLNNKNTSYKETTKVPF